MARNSMEKLGVVVGQVARRLANVISMFRVRNLVLPDVIIDEGTFKYVPLPRLERKYLVRGTLGAEFHKDVALPYVRAYLKDGFGVEILGGGRILHDVPRGFLKIYGFSYGFPWADGTGHEISAEVCSNFFSGYEVDWTNDGY
eukprot:s7433_g1.t1